MDGQYLFPQWLVGSRSVPVRREDGETYDLLQREVNRLFDSCFRGWDSSALTGKDRPSYVPSLDVSETDTEFRVEAELPGLEEKDVEVTLADGVLKIRGEKQAEKEEKTRRTHWVERSYGAFQRAIRVPEGIEEDKVNASFKKGILTVTIPKKPEVQKQTRRIPVKVE